MFWVILVVVIIAIIAYSKRDKIKQRIKASNLRDDREFIDKVDEFKRMKEIAKSFSEHISVSSVPVYSGDTSSAEPLSDRMVEFYYKSDIVFLNITDCRFSKYLFDKCYSCNCEDIGKSLEDYKDFLLAQTGISKKEFDKYFDIGKMIFNNHEDGLMENMSIPFKCPCGLTGEDKELFINAVNQQ